MENELLPQTPPPPAAPAAEARAEQGAGFDAGAKHHPTEFMESVKYCFNHYARFIGRARDSIAVPFEQNGQRFTLIDTAGVRKRGRVRETVEKFSIVKTLQAIEQANVCLLLLDAREGVTEQDAHLAGHLVESGRALVVVVNKWDGLDPDSRLSCQTVIGNSDLVIEIPKYTINMVSEHH